MNEQKFVSYSLIELVKLLSYISATNQKEKI